MRKSSSCGAITDIVAWQSIVANQEQIIPALIMSQAPVNNAYTCIVSTPPMLKSGGEVDIPATKDFVACMLTPHHSHHSDSECEDDDEECLGKERSDPSQQRQRRRRYVPDSNT